MPPTSWKDSRPDRLPIWTFVIKPHLKEQFADNRPAERPRGLQDCFPIDRAKVRGKNSNAR